MYDWVKALHVVAVVSWMAGLLYLPRLLVYHCETKVGSSEDERFRLMERRLMRSIMDPASLVVLASGAWLIWKSGYGWDNGWLLVKIVAVAGLLTIHGLLGRHRSQFARGEREHSAHYFRVLNEVPTALMIVIVVMVVVKPFG